MTDEFDLQLSSPNFIDAAQDRVASIASVDPLEVIFQGQQVAAVNSIPNLPLTVGDPVRVMRSAQQLVITGNMARYPVAAVVSAYAAGTANCTVVAGDDSFDAQTVGSFTPVVGDRVVLWWMANPTGNAYCFAARRGAAVSSPPDPPAAPDSMNITTGPDLVAPPPPPTGLQTRLVLAQQTACYNYETGALFTGDQANYWLYSGYRVAVSGPLIDSFWFYGDGISAIVGATVTKIEVYVQRATGVGPSGATDFYFRLHAAKTKPSTYPSLWFDSPDVIATSLSPGQGKWVTLPLSWGVSLSKSNEAKGLGITTYVDEPYKALIGIDHPDASKRNAQSGALRFTYKRS